MENKLATLNLLKNTYCRIKPSKIGGVGVFAIQDIPANTELFKGMIDQEWIKLTTQEISALPPEVLKMIDDFFVIENNSVSLPKGGLNSMDMSYYINSSTEPNAVTTDNGFTFFSSRAISKGEEVTISYATFDPKYRVGFK